MDRPTDSLRGLPFTTVLELMGVESMHDEETTERLKDLDDVAAKVRADTATREVVARSSAATRRGRFRNRLSEFLYKRTRSGG